MALLFLLAIFAIFAGTLSEMRILRAIHEPDSDTTGIGCAGDPRSDKDVLEELQELTGQNSESPDCPGPHLFPFLNRIAHNKTTSGGKIPRILHLSMKSRCLPQDLHDKLDEWKRVLPQESWSIVFHDDDAVNRLLYRPWPEFPHLQEVLACIKPGAMTIDIWRVLVIYKYGGVYSDIDNTPLEDFDPALIQEPDLTGFFLSDVWNRPSQWFFSFEPRHPMLFFAMQSILDTVYNMDTIQSPRLVFTTGPHVFKNGFARFLHDRADAFDPKGGYYVGVGGKKIRKIPLEHNNVGGAIGYNDMVSHPFDPSKNITRKQRIELYTGVEHWTKTRHKTTLEFEGSCKELLLKNILEALSADTEKELDSGSSPRPDSFSEESTNTSISLKIQVDELAS